MGTHSLRVAVIFSVIITTVRFFLPHILPPARRGCSLPAGTLSSLSPSDHGLGSFTANDRNQLRLTEANRTNTNSPQLLPGRPHPDVSRCRPRTVCICLVCQPLSWMRGHLDEHFQWTGPNRGELVPQTGGGCCYQEETKWVLSCSQHPANVQVWTGAGHSWQ